MMKMPRSNISYRPDIDGLRAWAVILVVLYHAGWAAVPGGFMGVDVFFVISGYLITKIIAAETAQNRFSIWRFYERRIRRIIPALAVMVLAVMAASAIWVLPVSLERFSKSAVAAMLFYANIHFWGASFNYFMPASGTNPLLHTWSLAVEEQFYLVYPLLFVIAPWLGRRGLLIVLALCGLASFALMLVGYTIAPTATFFLPASRAWEFLIGAVLALRIVPRLSHRGLSSAATLSGLIMILVSALTFNGSMAFPGWITLLPVLGAALVIHCADGAGAAARVPFEFAPLRQIGLISYSLYLWHWPILVLYEYHILSRPLTTAETVACVALSFVAAVLSYHLVEQPFRRTAWLQRTKVLMSAIAPLVAAVLIFAAVSLNTRGLPSRYPDFDRTALRKQLAYEADQSRTLGEECFVRAISEKFVKGCYLGARGKFNTLIWGDSFALHYLTALAERGSDQDDRGLVSLASTGCPPIIGYDAPGQAACKDINDRAIVLIDAMDVDTVILSANWFSYELVGRVSKADIADTVARLQALDVKVVLVGQGPVFSFRTPTEALFATKVSGHLGEKVGFVANRVPADFNITLERAVGADAFFDPSSLFCRGRACAFHNGKAFLFRDSGHVTLEGARIVAGPLLESTQRIKNVARDRILDGPIGSGISSP
ncbi:MAG: acyltransferase family protein [Sphingomonadaceae bacterium]